MNKTQGGIDPGGYTGTGYGFAQNRLAMAVPLPPMPQRPPVVGDPRISPGSLPLNETNLPFQGPSGPIAQPWWGQLGLPAFHFSTNNAAPLGVLGIQFSRSNSGGWSAV